MLFHQQPTDPWVPMDFLLLEAYQTLQDEICQKCGHPVWLCRSNSGNVTFEVKTGTCYAEIALESYKLRGLKKDDKREALKNKKNWGVFTYTVPVVPPMIQGELPTREEYYRDLAEKAKLTKDK